VRRYWEHLEAFSSCSRGGNGQACKALQGKVPASRGRARQLHPVKPCKPSTTCRTRIGSHENLYGLMLSSLERLTKRSFGLAILEVMLLAALSGFDVLRKTAADG
jgi:hypothetical protein